MTDRSRDEIPMGNQGLVDQGTLCGETYSTPAVDIYETGTEIVIMADLPGVTSEDLDIDLDGEVLSITGKATAAEHEGTVLLSEYSGRAYCRSFYLASLVDRRRISAALDDGVLTIRLPKAERKIVRKISVTTP